jgi:hypothetical protein
MTAKGRDRQDWGRCAVRLALVVTAFECYRRALDALKPAEDWTA